MHKFVPFLRRITVRLTHVVHALVEDVELNHIACKHYLVSCDE